jgi:hypothetical protein
MTDIAVEGIPVVARFQAAKVAIVWRGDKRARDTATGESSRLKAIFAALADAGFAPEPAVYDESFADLLRDQLLAVDAVLVFVDPVSAGARRTALDALLRMVAARGVFVSAHPDVIAKMGVKAVLHTTRALGWGTDTHVYETPADFAAAFPGRLASGPRVLKQNRSNGGQGVWKVTALAGGRVEVLPARTDLEAPRVLSLAELLVERAPDFGAAGGLVDQPFQPRLMEGMVRCYMSGGRVAGFGRQMVTALGPPEAGPAPPRLYSGPADPRFQRLRNSMEQDWTPAMVGVLGLTTHDLPVIWDADFLLGPPDSSGSDSYVLCEINCSSVFPMPDEAPAAMAATLRARLNAGDQVGL